MLISNIFAVSHALSQNSEIKFTHLDVDDGMSEETGLCIIQDSRGFIWIGTQIGLDRYDGYNFKVYFHDPYDSNSISDNGILSVIEDRDGFLWFGTRGGGLNKYDPVYDIFKHYKYDLTDPNSLSNNIVNVVFKDKTGILWLGTRGGGLNRFDKENEIFIHYKHDPSEKNSLSNNNVRSVYEDHSGTLWIGTEGGLNKFDRKRGTFIRYRHNPSDPVSISNNVINSIYEDQSGTLWIGTHGGGLNKLLPSVNEGSSPTFIHYKYDRDDPKSLSNNFINVMMEDKNGMLWIGTDNGLIIYSPKNETFITINPKRLNDNIIHSIYEDNTGSIWVGTWAGGVSKYDPRMEQFAHYYRIPDDPNSLSHNYVKGFEEDKNGMIWVLTHGGGLNKFDRKTGKFTHYKHQPGNPNSLSNNITRDICIDKNGILWIGTQGGGLNRFDPETDVFTHYKHDPYNPNSLCDDKIDAVFEDSKGILWIGTRGGGLNKFFPDSGIFVHYKHNPSDPKSISSNDIYVIHEDEKGTMWFGTWGGGINKIDRATGEFIRYIHDPNDTNSISYDVISAIYQDEPDILWIGTWGGGLIRFDIKREIFKAYTKKDGLPNNTVSTLSGDDHGNLWVCTNGLSKFSFQGREYDNPIIRNYDVHDGLQSNQFVGRANYKNAKGELFFGGTNGFNIFHPDSIKDASNVPPIVIISFKKFNKEAKLDKSIAYTRSIELDYRENVFSFEFVALDFSASHKNQYAYLMEGFDKDWIYTKEDRIAKYTNLDPGEYIFRVKGTNKDGVWNEESATIKITILPPFWQTWWFRISAIMALLIGIISIIKMRERSLKARQKFLKKIVNERTMELREEKNKVDKINIELEKLAIVARKTDNAIIICSPDGEMQWANAAFSRMNGYTLEEFKKIKGSSVQKAGTNPEISTLISKSIATKTSSVYEAIKNTKDNRQFWVQSTLTPVLDENGKIKSLVIIDTDITDIKEREAVIREKNQHIIDSLNYARIIQNAILPDPKMLNNIFAESFLIFKPKDIVSGDFYWFSEVPGNGGRGTKAGNQQITKSTNQQIIIAVCDCTGHGVPGAIMSMVGNDLLNQTILGKNITKPAEILRHLNEGIRFALKQDTEGVMAKDGMDMVICSITLVNGHACSLQYGGAIRPLWLFKKSPPLSTQRGEEGGLGYSSGGELSTRVGKGLAKLPLEGDKRGALIEIKGNRYCIGGEQLGTQVEYIGHNIEVKKGDTIYLSSDGYADQFGGPDNKKFMRKRFKELLSSMQHLNMEEQKQKLDKTIEVWRNDQEQTDDIMVIGIRF